MSWLIKSPLNLAPTNDPFPKFNLAPANDPFPKFKDHLPKFSGNGVMMTNKHLVAFSSACIHIDANENDVCMHLFVNPL